MLSSNGTAWYWSEGFFFSSFNSSIIRRTPVFFKENFDDMVYGKTFAFVASSVVCFTCVELLVLQWWSLLVLRMTLTMMLVRSGNKKKNEKKKRKKKEKMKKKKKKKRSERTREEEKN